MQAWRNLWVLGRRRYVITSPHTVMMVMKLGSLRSNQQRMELSVQVETGPPLTNPTSVALFLALNSPGSVVGTSLPGGDLYGFGSEFALPQGPWPPR